MHDSDVSLRTPRKNGAVPRPLEPNPDNFQRSQYSQIKTVLERQPK
jgi:hypothetical protein